MAYPPKATIDGPVEMTTAEKAEWDARQAAAPTHVATRKREERDYLLSACDWTQTADSALTTEKKAEWAAYRTALRDITDHADWPAYPHDPILDPADLSAPPTFEGDTWPTPPE